MNVKNKLIIASLAGASVLMSGGLVAQHTLAATDTTKDTLITKIASKFNLKEADVKAVFDEDRQGKGAEMEKKNEERLTQAVTDGELTSTQKDLIVAKQKEIQQKMEEARAKKDTTADPKTEMDALRTEIEEWATKNNIDKKWLMPFGGHHGERGPRGERGENGPQDKDIVPTT